MILVFVIMYVCMLVLLVFEFDDLYIKQIVMPWVMTHEWHNTKHTVTTVPKHYNTTHTELTRKT